MAAIRTGYLPRGGKWEPAWLFSLPGIRVARAFVYFGPDAAGNRIYALWCRAEPHLVPAFFQVRTTLFGERSEWLLRPVALPYPWWLPLAWWLARAGRASGEKLFYRGVLHCYADLARLALEGT